ncbi:hypothetical protein L2E82_30655 [Cichorium intybus]|uniref:Uncharacterized protein n=1 Tax=Cichorium intybus TaxID=13427 RepID=A0ACB9D154_CICIN|nr:hypothetical protein L2E82_30655 [Cichorium intybus]
MLVRNKTHCKLFTILLPQRGTGCGRKTHGNIMFKYIELCVDMRKGIFSIDSLSQYCIIHQQVNVNSLEELIKHFMDLSTKRVELARSQALGC